MKYTLLTGVTGLVGRYLLRDLLERDVPVAVLVRSSRMETAAQRVEAIMQLWEQAASRSLPRPVVLDGELCHEFLGLNPDHRAWVAAHCDTILHNAASMVFREDKHGEPFRTNVEGMRNVLALCEAAGIRKFHHVSTAYICGLRTGRVYENEIDRGQENGNVYEVSKLAAEKMVRAAPFLDQLTVYRPASIVGDSHSGYTTSSHGFYLPLQLAFVMADRVPAELMGTRFFELLGLSGHEGKNVVPVDWLAAAIAHVFTRPEHHGQTYHLTHPQPVSVQLIQQVIQEAIERYSTKRFLGTPTAEELAGYEALFQQYMGIYRSHWRDDPTFDRTNTDRAIGQLAVPEMDHDRMLRVAAYPIEKNFNLKRPELVEIPFDAGEHLRRVVVASGTKSTAAAGPSSVGVAVSGNGGGQWRLAIEGGNVVGLETGLGSSDCARYHLTSRTFTSLIERRSSIEQSLAAGRLVIEDCDATAPRPNHLRILKQLVSS